MDPTKESPPMDWTEPVEPSRSTTQAAGPSGADAEGMSQDSLTRQGAQGARRGGRVQGAIPKTGKTTPHPNYDGLTNMKEVTKELLAFGAEGPYLKPLGVGEETVLAKHCKILIDYADDALTQIRDEELLKRAMDGLANVQQTRTHHNLVFVEDVNRPLPGTLGFAKSLQFDSSDEDYEALKAAFEYQGYDPKHTKSVLASREKDTRRFADDMKKVCVFFCLRGTKIQKATRKMSEDGKRTMMALQDRYRITDSKPVDKDTITISRIAGVFPHIVVGIYHAKGLDGVFTDGELDGAPGQTAVPSCMRTPAFISMIPKRATSLKKAVFRISLMFTRKVSKKKVKVSEQKTFFDAAVNSPLYSEAERIEQCVWLGVLNHGEIDSNAWEWLYQDNQQEYEDAETDYYSSA